MSNIHPTAQISPKAVIGDDVAVGAFSVVGDDVVIRDRVRLHAHTVVEGRTEIGEGTEIYPFASIGQPAQIYKYKGEPGRLVIGQRCEIREYVTVSTGSDKAEGLTRIGDDCMLMLGAHVAHDCRIGNRVTLVNHATLGGHCEVGDFAIISALTGIQQFVRIGESAFVGGLCGVPTDLIPFGMCIGNRAQLGGLNLIGLKRRGFERDSIHALRKAYRLLFATDEGTLKERIDDVSGMFPDDPLVQKVISFIREGGDRAIMTTRNGRDG